MFRIIKTFSWGDVMFNIHHNDDVTIWKSYLIRKPKYMREVIEGINCYRDTSLSVWYHVCAWKVHNMFNRKKLDHFVITDDTNLFEKIGIVFLSLFYVTF